MLLPLYKESRIHCMAKQRREILGQHLQTYAVRLCSVPPPPARIRIQLLIDETARGFLNTSSKPAFDIAGGAQRA
jgi:hypothetical protein